MKIRRAELTDIRVMLDWAAFEGWNPGLDDAEAFQAADPEGFFVAQLEGSPVASISVVNHSADFAFLGLYIVRPEFRGNGFGKALWDEALSHAGARTVGLDGVPAQQENYRRSGFELAGSTARHTGAGGGRLSPAIRAATPEDTAALIEQEAHYSGLLKPDYLSSWYAAAPHRQTFVLPGPHGISGHVTLRACKDGHKIGPLCAETPEDAETLLRHCLALAEGPVSIDVPQSDADLTRICRQMGFSVGFETARMYRGLAPQPPRGLFAVATLELG